MIVGVSQVGLLVETDPIRGQTDFGQQRGPDAPPIDTTRIADTGFALTRGMHAFLAANPLWCDIFAFLNTLLVAWCQGYGAYMSLWVGEHGLLFRILFAASLRTFCGWLTYLPAAPEYLASQYDFPDVLTSGALQTILTTGTFPVTPQGSEVPPFVSFFSGHVANLVIVANFVYLRRGHPRAGRFLHLCNALQVVRLLATRGHYSIDIIVGWMVAVYVSLPAEHLGNYFSRIDSVKALDDAEYLLYDARWFDTLIYANGVKQTNRSSDEGAVPTPPLPQLCEAASRRGAAYAREAAGAAVGSASELTAAAVGRVGGLSARLSAAANLGYNTRAYAAALRSRIDDAVAARRAELLLFREACVERGLPLPTWL